MLAYSDNSYRVFIYVYFIRSRITAAFSSKFCLSSAKRIYRVFIRRTVSENVHVNSSIRYLRNCFTFCNFFKTDLCHDYRVSVCSFDLCMYLTNMVVTKLHWIEFSSYSLTCRIKSELGNKGKSTTYEYKQQRVVNRTYMKQKHKQKKYYLKVEETLWGKTKSNIKI